MPSPSAPPDARARPLAFPSARVERDAHHTFAVVCQHVRETDRVLDVGCGAGWVAAMLHGRGQREVIGVDVVDGRRTDIPHFELFDGVALPFPDQRFDAVVLAFVLHHVPNDRKRALLREVGRVVCGHVVVLEDTPVNWIDRLMNQLHGRAYRRSIGSRASFGFYTQAEWETLFRDEGFDVIASQRLPRTIRSPLMPFARSVVVLRRPARR
jgi:ubiquinone/menaquinone biosynthesis C-methylase UbiE